MHSRRYRQAAQCSVWLVAILGCSGTEPSDPMSAGITEPSVADSASAAPKSNLETVLAAIISLYDKQVTLTCPCFVEEGGYPDIDECKMWLGSRPDWLTCATAALQEYDNPAAIAALRCVESEAQVSNDCLETAVCGSPERNLCFSSPLKCLAEQIDLVLDLDNTCPDFSLLPRQMANETESAP
jgi:hypothetical protein